MRRRWHLSDALARVVAVALGLLILAITLAFSLAILLVFLMVAALVVGYAWWKVRSLRTGKGRIIEGEAGREIRPRDPG
jgi:hypothetical protein